MMGKNSPTSSRAVGRLLAQAMPRVEAVELEGMGHMGPITHPEEVNAVIEKVLRRIWSI
jgi:pimeloyl-ACP methyl ester carboxylesterase